MSQNDHWKMLNTHFITGKHGASCYVFVYRITFLYSSVCSALPLPSASVDAVVCDLPFGRKFGTKTDMAANLPLILTEMERLVPLSVHYYSLNCSVNKKKSSKLIMFI